MSPNCLKFSIRRLIVFKSIIGYDTEQLEAFAETAK